MKTKILHVITTISIGGAEIHLRELLAGLSRDKYQLELAFFKEEDLEARSLVPDFEDLGITVHDLGGEGRLSPGALIRLRRLIRQGGYGLVHSHLFRADLYAALARGSDNRACLINSVHNPEDFYENRWVAGLAKWAARRQSKTIVISRAVRNHLATHLDLRPEKMPLIYYGHLPKKITGLDFRSELDLPQDAFIVGTVGRLSAQKGHSTLIRAFAQIYSKNPRSRLVIVGHDDQGLRTEMESLIRKLDLEGIVILPGFREEIPDIMASFDLFCLPSLWEGFGMVLIEAMAQSRPVVASGVGSIPEVVVDGQTGILVEPGDEDGLAWAITRIMTDPEGAGRMGRAGFDRQAEVFSREAMVRATEQVYDQLLSTGQGRVR